MNIGSEKSETSVASDSAVPNNMGMNDEKVRKSSGDEMISPPYSDNKIRGGNTSSAFVPFFAVSALPQFLLENQQAPMTAHTDDCSECARLEELLCRVRASITSDPRYETAPSDEELVNNWTSEQKERRKPAKDVPKIEILREKWLEFHRDRETVMEKFSKLAIQFEQHKEAGTHLDFEDKLLGFITDNGEVLCWTAQKCKSSCFRGLEGKSTHHQ